MTETFHDSWRVEPAVINMIVADVSHQTWTNKLDIPSLLPLASRYVFPQILFRCVHTSIICPFVCVYVCIYMHRCIHRYIYIYVCTTQLHCCSFLHQFHPNKDFLQISTTIPSLLQVQSSLDQLYSAMEALVRQRSADVQLVNSYLGRPAGSETNLESFRKNCVQRFCVAQFDWDVFLYGFGRLSSFIVCFFLYKIL